MSLQARTQSINVSVDDSLLGTLALGLLEAERDRVTQRLVAHYAGKQPADIPGVAETRTLFRRLDIDPTKSRPSSEALLRRVLQGKGLPKVNSTVDVCNLCSLSHQIPLGLYDREAVKGDRKSVV